MTTKIKIGSFYLGSDSAIRLVVTDIGSIQYRKFSCRNLSGELVDGNLYSADKVSFDAIYSDKEIFCFFNENKKYEIL